MEIVVIEIEKTKLQLLHDAGVLKPGDYEAIEVFEKGFKDTPEYLNLITKKKEAFAAFKKEEKEIEDLINDLRDDYNRKNGKQS